MSASPVSHRAQPVRFAVYSHGVSQGLRDLVVQVGQCSAGAFVVVLAGAEDVFDVLLGPVPERGEGSAQGLPEGGELVLHCGGISGYMVRERIPSRSRSRRVSVRTLPLMPSTASRSAPNRNGPSLRAITIIAVHLFAILAKEVREGQVATITSQGGLDIEVLSLGSL